jgi:membrane protein required for colicin V production
MTITDIIILVCMVVGAGIGFKKGLVWQAITIVGLVLGFIVAKYLYLYVAEKYISPVTDSFTVAQIFAFVGIWIFIPLVFSLVGLLLTKVVDVVSLGCFNRLLGAALGVVKYMFFIGVVIYVLDYFDTRNHVISREKKEASLFYYPLKAFAGKVFPVIIGLKEKDIMEQKDNEGTTNKRA